jgi:hypothetical protein
MTTTDGFEGFEARRRGAGGSPLATRVAGRVRSGAHDLPAALPQEAARVRRGLVPT